jgi:hypothetical protein
MVTQTHTHTHNTHTYVMLCCVKSHSTCLLMCSYPGTYQGEWGSAACQSCPAFATTQAPLNWTLIEALDATSFEQLVMPLRLTGSVDMRNCSCSPGNYHSLIRAAEGLCNKELCCVPCDDERSICQGSISPISESNPSPQTQPYARPGFYRIISPAEVKFAECTPRQACFGGPARACSEGYEGFACGRCARYL